jgi:hypothetical protein
VTLSFDWGILAALLLENEFCDFFCDIDGNRSDASCVDVEADEKDASSTDHGRQDGSKKRKLRSIQRDSGSRAKCLPMIRSKGWFGVSIMKG